MTEPELRDMLEELFQLGSEHGSWMEGVVRTPTDEGSIQAAELKDKVVAAWKNDTLITWRLVFEQMHVISLVEAAVADLLRKISGGA